MKKIMIVEDEDAICNELSELLENNNYKAIILKDFKNALNEILSSSPNLILLDINIPYINGETDEALSISYGADDYITKPYNPNILLLRIGAVLKRVNNESNILTYKDLSINIGKGIIKRDDMEIILTKNEMIIFSYLLNHQNKIVTRDELMTDLWNNEEFINDNALTVNISRLRAKLKNIGYEDAIDTRKGMGYILS